MRYFVEWLALKGVLSHLRSVPLDVAFARTRRLARVGRRVLRHDWYWALRNLALIFGPDLGEEARHRLAALAFEQHFFSYMERLRRTTQYAGPAIFPRRIWRMSRGHAAARRRGGLVSASGSRYRGQSPWWGGPRGLGRHTARMRRRAERSIR